MRRVPIVLDCPGCHAPADASDIDGARGVLFRCTVHTNAHVWVWIGRDVFEAPMDGVVPPGWSPAHAPVATVPPKYDTCPRCERRIEIVHNGSVADGIERADPWEFVEHRRMREDGRGGERCPASGNNTFSATHQR